MIRIKKKIPGPSQYKGTVSKSKIVGNYNVKDDKYCFIDTAKFESSLTPGHKYKGDYLLQKERSMSMKYYPIKKERFEKIQKTKDPGPGFYKTEEGFRKTLLNSCEHKFVKTEKSCFFGMLCLS